MSLHFWTPALAKVAASATLVTPLMTCPEKSVPSPSSQTYKVDASANQIPKGNETGWPIVRSCASPLASVVGKPDRILMGTFLRLGGFPGASEGVGKIPAVPT